MKLADFAIKHPVIITILVVAIVLFGIISLRGLRQDMFGDVSTPTVVVFTVYPGVGPRDIEREVTDVLENELSTLDGVEDISSTSGDSVSIISLDFDWNEDVDVKMPAVREKINNAAGELPEWIAGPPTMFNINPEMLPILSIALTGEMGREELTRFADDFILPSLARISGVATVQLKGGVTSIVDIQLDLDQLEARGIAVLDVYQQLKYGNVSFPAGSVVFRNRELKLRTMGEFDSLDEIENLVVGYTDNTYIRLRDIATVELVEADPEMYATSEGEEIIVIDVMKQPGTDTTEIKEKAFDVFDDIKADHPGLIEFVPIADQGEDISLAINTVRNSAILGGILAVLVLLLFLHNLRTTLIISVSIPLAVVFAFIAMSIKDQSLNIMTLGGLTVGIGMIVDSSIVVLENIHKNFRKTGDKKKAASVGTSEVGGAIIASTTTSLCVFIPILFVRSYAGEILQDSALAIIYALTAALFVAIFVVPFISSLFLRRERENRHRFVKALSSGIESGITGLERVYRKALRWALNNKGFILMFAVAVLIMSVLAFDFIGFEFVPETDMNEIQIRIETPNGYSLEETREKVEEIEKILYTLVPEVENTLFYTGQSDSFGFVTTPNSAFGRVRLINSKKRDRDIFTIIKKLQRELPARVTDTNVTVVNGGFGALAAMAMGGQGFMIEVYGSDIDDVVQTAKTVEEIMKQDPNTEKTEMNVSFRQQEIVSDLALDYMGNLGVVPQEAAVTSRIVFNGMETGTYRTEDQSHEILLRSELAGGKVGEDVLERMVLRSQSGKLITFANFSDMRVQPSISAIHHQNKMKSVIVTAYLKQPDFRSTSARVTKQLKSAGMPPGVNWQIEGSAAGMMDSFRTLLFAIGISVFLVYTVMVIQFERFTQPLIIMASVPFTVIGVTAGLLLFGSTLSIVAFMGLIALAGIVVNNAIVLVDYINLIRKRDGKDIFEAILDGGSSRLKPILMTTITTILGLLPLALNVGAGAEVYAPLGQTIAGGLLTSTLITLFLVPVLYYILETRKARRQPQLRPSDSRGTGGPSPQPSFNHEDPPPSQGGDI